MDERASACYSTFRRRFPSFSGDYFPASAATSMAYLHPRSIKRRPGVSGVPNGGETGVRERLSVPVPRVVSRRRRAPVAGGFPLPVHECMQDSCAQRTRGGQHHKADGGNTQHPGNPAPSCLIHKAPERCEVP